MSSIAVLGPGGVGGFLAAALARAEEDVVVVGRPETVAVIAAHGLRVSSALLGDFSVPVRASARLTGEVGTLFVATKALGLEAALSRIEGRPGLVVPLLNGFEHMTPLRARFGPDAVAAGTIRIEADRPAPGVVTQTSPGVRVELAADRADVAARLPAVVQMLSRAGLSASVESPEADVLWSKLVRLVALAVTTSAADAPIGVISADPEWRPRLLAVIAEAAAVATAEGAAADPAERIAELDAAHPSLGSSMQRDIAAGREPELDAIAGAVLRAGRRHGLECPVLAELAGVVARRAAGGGGRA